MLAVTGKPIPRPLVPPGTVWCLVGWMVLLVAIVCCALSRLNGTFRLFPLYVLYLGGMLAIPLMLIGCARGADARRNQVKSRWRVTLGMDLAVAGGVVYAFLFVIMFADRIWMERREAQWVDEAQATVEAYLQQNPEEVLNSPVNFKGIEGEGHHAPFWNTRGYYYLIADRTAYFSSGQVSLRIFVTEGRLTAPDEDGVGRPQLKRIATDEVEVFVSHAELKR